jgi:hypothetical protein
MEYNNLDLLNERRLEYLPPHFSLFHLDDKIVFSEKENILSWIRTKLNGRYAMLKFVGIGPDQKSKSRLTLGFENPSELTYFIIACPFLRRQ